MLTKVLEEGQGTRRLATSRNRAFNKGKGSIGKLPGNWFAQQCWKTIQGLGLKE